MALLRTGPGIKIAETSKPMMPFSPGTVLFKMSWAVSHSESSWTNGTMMMQFASAVFNQQGCKPLEIMNQACK
jgi:hypothetical protein